MDGTIQSQRTDSSKLVQRFQDGEREAFDALVNLYQHRVLKLTYQFTRNPEDAADLAQEAFLRAFQGLESFQGKSLNRLRIADCGLRIADCGLRIAEFEHKKRENNTKDARGVH